MTNNIWESSYKVAHSSVSHDNYWSYCLYVRYLTNFIGIKTEEDLIKCTSYNKSIIKQLQRKVDLELFNGNLMKQLKNLTV